jgi:hypothetical protein
MKNRQTGRHETFRGSILASGAVALALLGAGAAGAQAAEDPGVQRARPAISGQARVQRQQQRAPVALAEARATGRYHGAAVDAAELQEMRGGFIGRSGALVRFGFDISTHVNGVLRQRLTMQDTDITRNTQSITVNQTGQNGGPPVPVTITQANLASAPAEFREVLNNGATTLSTTLSSRGIVSAIQNSANNQLIQRSATINLEVVGLRNIMNQNSGHRFIANALATRSVFGR